MARKLDVLLESACRHPEDFTALVTAFGVAGYHVCVVLMAVPECLSLLGVVARYYLRKGEGPLQESGGSKLPLRLTPRRVHDETFEGLRAAVKFVDHAGEVSCCAPGWTRGV